MKYQDIKRSMMELVNREKALQLEIAELTSEIADHVHCIGLAEAEIFEKTMRLEIIKKSRAKLDIDFERRNIIRKGVRVSEHAIIQYLRRVLNIDIDTIVDEMMSNDGLEDQIKTIGDGKYPINENTTGVVVGGTLVTVLSNNKEKEKSDDRGIKERLLG